jgi:hypothetical protein
MMKLTRIVPAAILLTVAVQTVSAAGLDTGQVSANAIWVAHIDSDALRGTELGGYITSEMTTEEANPKFDAMKAIFKFDLRTDLKSVTLYGKGKGKEEGVALFSARFDTDHLVTLVKANEHYASQMHGARTIHSWIDEKKPGKRTYGCVVKDDLIVLGDAERLVKDAVDVIDGRAENMSNAESLPGLADAAKSTFFIGSADMSQMPDIDPKAAVLKQNKAVSLSFSEEGGRLKGNLRMVAKDAETATAVYSIAQGLISLVSLNEDADQWILAMASALKLGVNDNEVSVLLDYPAADAIRFFQERKKKEKPASEF